ncbi:MAG: DpnD/PcfM family protein [Oscillospiraceae bacterium]|nr:DpnD/PcfM family protein [Oscillospiraceae bacterium]
MEYDIRVSETQQFYITVNAENMADAKRIASEKLKAGEYTPSETATKSVKLDPLYPGSPRQYERNEFAR